MNSSFGEFSGWTSTQKQCHVARAVCHGSAETRLDGPGRRRDCCTVVTARKRRVLLLDTDSLTTHAPRAPWDIFLLFVLRWSAPCNAVRWLITGSALLGRIDGRANCTGRDNCRPGHSDRLDDSTFWRNDHGFSEPSGYSPPRTSSQTKPPGSGHSAALATISQTGVSGRRPQKLHVHRLLQAEIAFIVDIRRQNLLQHMCTRPCRKCPSTAPTFCLGCVDAPVRRMDTSATADALIPHTRVRRGTACVQAHL